MADETASVNAFKKNAEAIKIPVNVPERKYTPDQKKEDNNPSLDVKRSENSNHIIECKLQINDKENSIYNISNYVDEIKFSRNFEDDFKPWYFISFMLPVEHYQRINIYKKFKILLKIRSSDRYVFSNDHDFSIQPNEKRMIKDIDVVLVPYNFNPDTNNELSKANASGSLVGKNIKIPFQCFFFEYRHIKTGHTVESANYRNQNIQNIIIDVINKYKAGSLKNINKLVFAKPDFNSVISNVTIPPKPLRLCLEYLQEMHNIYNRKAIFFVDFDTLYVIKRGYNSSLINNIDNKINVIVGAFNCY